jgi:hypothetical protein
LRGVELQALAAMLSHRDQQDEIDDGGVMNAFERELLRCCAEVCLLASEAALQEISLDPDLRLTPLPRPDEPRSAFLDRHFRELNRLRVQIQGALELLK